MKAIAGITAKHMALLYEYRIALSLWTETRALYVPDAVEIAQATQGTLRILSTSWCSATCRRLRLD